MAVGAGRFLRKAIRWTSLFACSLFVAALPAMAEKRTRVLPSLSLDQGFTDNVLFGDLGGTSSDSSTRLGFALNVIREMRKGELRLRYNTAFTKYRDFSELDEGSHRFGLDFGSSGRQGTWSLTTRYTRSQDQIDFEDLADPEINLSRRTTRETVRAKLGYGRSVRRGRWYWSASLGGTSHQFDDIEGLAVDPDLEVEDRTTYTTGLTLKRVLSRRTSLGVRYGYADSDLDVSPDETHQDLGLALDKSLSKTTKLVLELGGFRRSREESTAPTVTTEEDSTGFRGSLRISRQLQAVALGVNAYHGASAGGVLRGTSTDSSVAVSVGRGRERGRPLRSAGPIFDWIASLGATRRDPTDTAEDTVDSVALTGKMSIEITRDLRFRIQATCAEQSGASASFCEGRMGITWDPLARKGERRKRESDS